MKTLGQLIFAVALVMASCMARAGVYTVQDLQSGTTSLTLSNLTLNGTRFTIGNSGGQVLNNFTSMGDFVPVAAISYEQLLNGSTNWSGAFGSMSDTNNFVGSWMRASGSASGGLNIRSQFSFEASGPTNNATIGIVAYNAGSFGNLAQLTVQGGDGPQLTISSQEADPENSFVMFDQLTLLSSGAIMTSTTNRWLLLGITVDGGVTNAHFNLNGTNWHTPFIQD